MFNFLFKPKKCTICNLPAGDLLVTNGKATEYFCRKHVIQKFSEAFLTFTYKFVVFHPEQNRKYCGTMYPFYPVSDMVPRFFFKEEDAQIVEKYLGMITGLCSKCQEQNASCAYFSKGVLRWDRLGPLIREVDSKPEILCNKCALEKISSDLTNNKENFQDNGLFVPYGSEGVYVNTYL